MKDLKIPKNSVLGMYTDWVREGESYGAIGWYRIINPLGKMGANIVGKYTLGSIQSAIELGKWGKVWFMRPSDSENVSVLIDAARQFTGAKLVIDMDDDLRHVNPDHPEKEILDKKAPEVIKQLKFADHIVVTTPQLKESFKDLNDRITVIPNSIDPKIWDVKRKKRNDGIIRIGWVASASHYSDIPIIEKPIKEILAKYPNVEFHMMGVIPEELQEDRRYHHKGTNGYKEFPQFLADFDFDIAIAPLKDNQFNRCKSNIKWLEHSMLEIPMVLSPVAPYKDSVEHGKTGFFAKNRKEWVKYLSLLIENAQLRQEIGHNAKEEVLKNWTITKFLPLYANLLNNLMAERDITVITSICGGKDDLNEVPESKRAEYLCFTDKELHSPNWKILPACQKFKNPVMNAKIHKILSHKYTDSEYIIWMDGNFKLKVPPEKLIEQLGDKDIALFRHPTRDCIYDEQIACLQLGKGNPEEINEQIKAYADPTKGLHTPAHKGLCECGLIVRRNKPEVNSLFEKWWVEVCRYSERDQLSFPRVFDFKNIKILPGLSYDNEFVQLIPHKK